jgi:predicted RNase H-like nuclease
MAMTGGRTPMHSQPGYRVAGVDGCSGGWVVVMAGYRAREPRPVTMSARLCPTFADVLEIVPRPAAIAVDMPIGLLDRAIPGGRACDREARAVLGRMRGSSVFSPPSRPALGNSGYRDAIERNGLGMSMQTYNILPKVREVDEAMTPALQETIVEAHPELAFAGLAGQPMRHNKKTASGRRERLRCLREAFAGALQDLLALRAQLGPGKAGLDDVIDACVLAHAAWRIVAGSASRLPAGAPPRDARGLRMEVWF